MSQNSESFTKVDTAPHPRSNFNELVNWTHFFPCGVTIIE